jgi:hypothetical protein
MEFIQELVQDHTTFTEPYKHQVSFIQVETFSPPQWSHFLILLFLCLLKKYSIRIICVFPHVPVQLLSYHLTCVSTKLNVSAVPHIHLPSLDVSIYFQYLIIKCHKFIQQCCCFIRGTGLILMSAAWTPIKSITSSIP